MKNKLWVEKYRPSQFQDIVLDPLNRELFQNMLNKQYFPHLLFYGPPGTGKTTTIINLINEYQAQGKIVPDPTYGNLSASSVMQNPTFNPYENPV